MAIEKRLVEELTLIATKTGFKKELILKDYYITVLLHLMKDLKGIYFKGGTALQINVIDPETLKQAQRNPSDYTKLLVRVTGYNAYFVMLGREIQNEIIARESHEL